MHSLICAILAASIGKSIGGTEWVNYESRNYPSVTTNVVVCLQITKEYAEPCPCPDGMVGCCVAHYKNVKKTTFTPVKHLSKYLDANRGVGIKIPILKELLMYADEFGAKGEIVPIRAVNGKGHIMCEDEPVGWFLRSKAQDFVASEENKMMED